jgi:hypothetical protein
LMSGCERGTFMIKQLLFSRIPLTPIVPGSCNAAIKMLAIRLFSS